MKKSDIIYRFEKPEEIPSRILDQIHNLIEACGGVGTSWVKENLRDAFIIGYAEHDGKIVGTSTHKYPKEEYRKKIETVTGLNLTGYLERGYTAVKAEYRDLGIGGRLIRGLIEKSENEKVYVTIRMDNIPPLKMTYKEGMVLAGKFINEITGHELGVFANVMPPKKYPGQKGIG